MVNKDAVKDSVKDARDKDLKKKEESTNRLKALELALSQIEKQFGKGAIMKMGEDVRSDIAVIPTGSISLDLALGVGGIPRGRIIEIFGPEASGKTTLTLSVIAQVQRQSGVAAFIDAEHAFDSTYAKKIGVNLDELLISQPDTGEQALDIAETLVRSNAVDLIVIDSVAALTPKAEIEGDMGDSHMGLQARLMSQALRKLTGTISKSKTCVIFINQIREKIGVMFGNPETTTGGRALKFYSSVRIDLRRITYLKSGDEVIGSKVRIRVVKNKVAPPFKETEVDFLHSEGISKEYDLIDTGLTIGLLTKSGAWILMGEQKLGNGRDAVRQFLRENPKIAADIDKKIRQEHQKRLHEAQLAHTPSIEKK